MRTWIFVLALGLCTGCPTPEGPKQTAKLNLDSSDVPAPLTIGASANLSLTLQRGEVGELFSAGAFIADDSSQRLTEWHAQPANAVKFDPATNRVTFEVAGEVKVWASWADADGTPLQSNSLTFTVAGK